MLSRFRFALRPGWLLVHLVAVALVVTMALLGRWQLDVSNAKHFNLRNFGYALQWWAFCTFVVLMWIRVMRDALRHPSGTVPVVAPAPAAAPETVAYRRYVMPQQPAAPVDETHAAYNDYLAALAAEDTALGRDGR